MVILKPFLHFEERERESVVIHSHCLWNYVSERFQITFFQIPFFKLFQKEIWIGTSPSALTISSWSDWEIVTSALQLFYPHWTEIETALLHVMPNLSWQVRHQLDQFLRSAFIETADQTSQSDYQPINRSTPSLRKSDSLLFQNSIIML